MLRKTALVFLFILLPVWFAMASGPGGKERSIDQGKQPWTVDIEDLTKNNTNFRTTMWTGDYLQMTVMSIEPGGEIGLEKHDRGDQFIRVEEGKARVLMGASREKLTLNEKLSDDWAILIPAGFWHNIINEGDKPLKVYVIYSPPEHPAGTLHKTSEEAEAGH